jgi:hypothetical protein
MLSVALWGKKQGWNREGACVVKWETELDVFLNAFGSLLKISLSFISFLCLFLL